MLKVNVKGYLGSSASSGIGSTISAGTGSATGYTVHTFTSSGTLNLASFNLMLTGTISGTGSMIDNASGGKISLISANTYTGTTTLSGGTLGIYNSNAISPAALTLGNNTTLLLGRTISGLTNNITLNGAATVAFDNTIDFLVVGAGGGGGSDGGGGGGGGAIVSQTGIDIGAATTLTAAVGAGGIFGEWSTPYRSGGAGGNSSLSFGGSTYIATGGSGGISGPSAAGGSGGSGNQSTSNGGSGGAGTSGNTGLNGGNGPTSSISGVLTNYGGGGGGGVTFTNSGTFTGGAGGAGGGGAGTVISNNAPTSYALAGSPNSGGGGGAGTASYLTATPGVGDGTGYRTPGGSGGSGVVIVRYLGPDASTNGSGSVGTGLAIGYTLNTFNSSNALTLKALSATFSGSISGAGSLTANPSSGGTFLFTSNNSYAGSTTVSSGTYNSEW